MGCLSPLTIPECIPKNPGFSTIDFPVVGEALRPKSALNCTKKKEFPKIAWGIIIFSTFWPKYLKKIKNLLPTNYLPYFCLTMARKPGFMAQDR